jgi:LytS/YehU family sensor histidine kinase
MLSRDLIEKKSLSFILGCPMFVVIMEMMGARRTQGVRQSIILANVFTGILIGVIVGIHHGVLYGLWACSFGALTAIFLNYFYVGYKKMVFYLSSLRRELCIGGKF